MTPHDYECILAAANLAHYHPTWGFTVLVDRWKNFLEGHHFNTSKGMGSFEVDTKKLDVNAFILGTSAKHRVKVHVIRIGIVNEYSPRKIEMQIRDSRMIYTPPRMNGIQIKPQSFRKCMDPFVWNYVVDNGLEQGNIVKDSSSEDDESVIISC
jgi:hypothetical protein